MECKWNVERAAILADDETFLFEDEMAARERDKSLLERDYYFYICVVQNNKENKLQRIKETFAILSRREREDLPLESQHFAYKLLFYDSSSQAVKRLIK